MRLSVCTGTRRRARMDVLSFQELFQPVADIGNVRVFLGGC